MTYKGKQLLYSFALIIAVVITIFLLFTVIKFGGNETKKEFTEFRTEIMQIAEKHEFTQTQFEQLNYNLELYKDKSTEGSVLIRLYSKEKFETFVKERDYSFWQDIKIIFKE